MLKKIVGGLFAKKLNTAFSPSLDQRRKASRRPCEFRVECLAGSKGFEATVIDIGAGGLRLRADTPIPVQKQVTIQVTHPELAHKVQDATVECVARWTREIGGYRHFGLEFANPSPKAMGRSWVKHLMKDLGFQSYNIKDQRKKVRVSCSLKATIQLGGDALAVDVQNVGMGGVFGELRKPLRAGASVNLKVLETDDFPSAVFPVTVRHQQHADPSSPYGYGLAFSEIPSSVREALENLILSRQGEGWNAGAEPVFGFDPSLEQGGRPSDVEDVEIPDLQTIMDETEPEEEEEEEEEEEPEEMEGEEVEEEPKPEA